MTQETIDFESKPKTAQDMVLEFLKNHSGKYYTGFEIADEINVDGFKMTEGSCSKYCRNLRKILSCRPRERERNKPFIEWTFIEAKIQQEV